MAVANLPTPQQAADELDALDRGLDALELRVTAAAPFWRRATRASARAVIPKLVAVAILLGIWQLAVSLQLKPTYILPAPLDVWHAFTDAWQAGVVTQAIETSLRRGAVGYLISIAIGTPLGLLIARVTVVRLAIGSLVSALQSLPSVVWVPLAILAFGLNDATIYFVVVMGAVPSIAQGLVSAVDTLPPLLLRAGRSMGARGPALYRHVILPAALPGYVAGLKQAWSFSWRSLMAAELITQSPDLGIGLGQVLDNGRSQSDMTVVVMAVLLILAVGVAIDGLVFRPVERAVLRRRGLASPAA